MKLSKLQQQHEGLKISKSDPNQLPWAFRVMPFGNGFVVEGMSPWHRTFTPITRFSTEEAAKEAMGVFQNGLK